MRKGNVKVEQITNDFTIVSDYGEILLPSELAKIFTDNIPNTDYKNGYIYGAYHGNKYCIVFKNISYLGNPHPIHKKRFQIPPTLKNTYNDNKKQNIKTLMVGIYKYKDVLLFCGFNTENYICNKLNNSSAHVYSIDLLNGLRIGFFKKKDIRGNDIFVFNEKNINTFFDYIFNNNIDSSFEIFETVDEFFSSVAKEWFGMECYMEMLENHYHDSLQGEWAGAYLEYKFGEYLDANKKKEIISFYQDKKDGGIDLDLYFPKMGIYGDLKAHTIDSGGIQGNDYETIMSLLDHQSIYYIVCNHTTEKDIDHDSVVTKFWNQQLKKDDLLSYSKKMKYKVDIKNYYILELNKYNKKYISKYNQGKNSDGKPRRPKISISKRNIPVFLVHVLELDDIDDKN